MESQEDGLLNNWELATPLFGDMKQVILMYPNQSYFMLPIYFTSLQTISSKMPKFTPDQIGDYREFFTILANIRRRQMITQHPRDGPIGK